MQRPVCPVNGLVDGHRTICAFADPPANPANSATSATVESFFPSIVILSSENLFVNAPPPVLVEHELGSGTREGLLGNHVNADRSTAKRRGAPEFAALSCVNAGHADRHGTHHFDEAFDEG